MVALLDLVALEPQNLTAITDVNVGVERHLADSLVAAALDVVRTAPTICDIGSGGGFPGLPLAMLLPECALTLVESERAKAAWLGRASAGSPNVRVVAERTETLAGSERERFAVVTARAVGALPVVMELAAPLTALGGALVAWRGRLDRDEDASAAAAAGELGFVHERTMRVDPVAGAVRHLDVWRKERLTPARYPRRPGRAAKRPLG